MGKRRPTRVEPPSIVPSLHGEPPDEIVDLHGLTAAAALRRVDHVLERRSRLTGSSVVRFVTGRGRHSPDGPVLLDAVGSLLRDEQGRRVAEIARDVGGGAWLARIGESGNG